MKIKKILLPLLSILLLSTVGCNGSKNLEPNIIKDQYRTYYEIFVGAYSDSDKNGIGDFKGLYNRLDYINDGNPSKGNDLGVDGIWLMPIMPANSYHKYDVIDYKAERNSYRFFYLKTLLFEKQKLEKLIQMLKGRRDGKKFKMVS